ncbi:hypothetical protein PEC18_30515 [Paucibacter sp. O1-1]|nr:hypothetical protein [Paucibacter sp. O1-1]
MSTNALHLGLSTLFIRKNILNEEQVSAAIASSRKNKQTFVTTLIMDKIISAREVAELCYEEYGTPSSRLK